MLLPESAAEAGAIALSYIKSHYFLVGFGLVVAKLASTVIYNKWFHPLSRFPGPFFAAVSDWYCVYTFFTYKSEELEYALHKKYGECLLF